MIWQTFGQTVPQPDPSSGWIGVIQNVSGWVVLMAMVLSMQLIPKPFYKDKDRECQLWRENYEKERQRNDLLEKSIESLVEQGKTTVHLLEGIKAESEAARRR